MKPVEKLETDTLADGTIVELIKRDEHYFLLRDGIQVAGSFAHGSDDALAQLGVAPVARANQPLFLFDGINLGFVLAMALRAVPREKATFVVAEPHYTLCAWHEKHLKNLHGDIFFDDPRIEMEVIPLVDVARKSPNKFHGIFIKHTHETLRLKMEDAADLAGALKSGSLLAISIARLDTRLIKTLQRAGFAVAWEFVPAAHKGKQAKLHTIILARKGRFQSHQQRPTRKR